LSEPPNAAQVAAEVARAFERVGISYAIGGALAYGLYGAPRATLDVDVNLFVEPEALAPVFEVLRELGATFDEAQARREAAEEGLFVAWLHGHRLDLFVPSIPFCREAERTRVRLPAPPYLAAAFFLSAEAITLFKLLFFRSKDLADLERLVARQGERLDVRYVRERLVEMMGEDDVRVRRWDELVQEFGVAAGGGPSGPGPGRAP